MLVPGELRRAEAQVDLVPLAVEVRLFLLPATVSSFRELALSVLEWVRSTETLRLVVHSIGPSSSKVATRLLLTRLTRYIGSHMDLGGLSTRRIFGSAVAAVLAALVATAKSSPNPPLSPSQPSVSSESDSIHGAGSTELLSPTRRTCNSAGIQHFVHILQTHVTNVKR